MKEVVVDVEADLEEHLVEIQHMSSLSNEYIVNYRQSYLNKRKPSGYILWVCTKSKTRLANFSDLYGVLCLWLNL